MSLEAAIMGFLAEHPRSGYDLKTQCFDRRVSAFWPADQAQIYRTLERLHAAKLVARTRRRQTGKPDRKIYSLTDAGVEALAVWQTCTLPLPSERDAFLLQIYFADRMADREILENLVSRRRAHQTRLELLRAEVAAHAGRTGTAQRSAALRVAAFDGAIARERASIDWLDDTIDAIESDQLPVAGRSATEATGGATGGNSA